MSIEKRNGVHVNERLQVKKINGKTKTKAEQYAEFHKLNWAMCDSDKVLDVNEIGKVTVLEE